MTPPRGVAGLGFRASRIMRTKQDVYGVQVNRKDQNSPKNLIQYGLKAQKPQNMSP